MTNSIINGKIFNKIFRNILRIKEIQKYWIKIVDNSNNSKSFSKESMGGVLLPCLREIHSRIIKQMKQLYTTPVQCKADGNKAPLSIFLHCLPLS